MTEHHYPNPLIKQRADPFITLHTDGYYYFTASVPEYDRLELRRAPSLIGLAQAEAVTVWQKPQQGPMSALIWAPELHFIAGNGTSTLRRPIHRRSPMAYSNTVCLL